MRRCNLWFEGFSEIWNKNQILASLRFASTEDRVTRSSKQMQCGWDHLIGGLFLLIFIYIY